MSFAIGPNWLYPLLPSQRNTAVTTQVQFILLSSDLTFLAIRRRAVERRVLPQVFLDIEEGASSAKKSLMRPEPSDLSSVRTSRVMSLKASSRVSL